jgi:DcuC family C4-dicarboxylate transporter
MVLLIGLLVIAAAVFGVLRGIDVRLVLALAALALGTIGGDLPAVVRVMLATMAREQFVVPICSAMGFAHVLRLTGCDQHLVHLLVRPLQRVRPILIPGAVLVGFLVNIPVISQTSTAVAVGPVLVPLLLASRISPLTTGAALLLGASLGGELLNPGAPELRTVAGALDVQATDCVAHVLPLLIVQLLVATLLFWILSTRTESKHPYADNASSELATHDDFRISYVKAAVPLLPLVLLFLTGGPAYLLRVPRTWLVDPDNLAEQPLYDGRMIAAAMLVGVFAAALTNPQVIPRVAKAFFEGAGYAYANIISLIVTATGFGMGVEKIGLAERIGELSIAAPALFLPGAGCLPLAFAWVSGSGMAATQSLFRFYTGPAVELGFNPLRIGAIVSIAAAAGRTMSPVSAVALMCGSLTETNALALSRRVALPLLIGLAAVVGVAMLLER